MRFIKFYKDSMKLGLTKTIIFISMFLYFASVFFEAIGIFLILPIIALFFTGEGLENILGSPRIINDVMQYLEIIGIENDKYTLVVLLIIAILIRQIIVFLRACWNAVIISKLTYYLRKKAFNRFLSVKEDFFHSTSSGDTINDLTKEGDRAAAVIMSGIEILGIVCIFLVYLFMMLYLSIVFTIFAIVSFMVAILLLKTLWRQSSEVGQDITLNNRLFMTHIGQRFSNLRLLKLTGDSVHEGNLIKSIISEQRKKQVRSGLLISITNSCIEPIILISGGLILYGAVNIFNQELLNLGIFSLIMIRGLPMVRNAFSSWQLVEGAWPSLNAVIDTFSKLEKNKEYSDGKISLSNKKAPSIILENVDYSYSSRNEKIIKSVSFNINSGELVGIVGPSGAGKSTIVDFIPRLKIPDNGNIYINNTNVNDINLYELRKNIGFLAQVPQIIEGSIKEHISFGNQNITDLEIIESLKKVSCGELLNRLDEGINTNIGANGTKLSGGERQRIDLARVLARKTPILILDEPASNLDSITEKAILKAINQERKERGITIIVIGHKLKWFEFFDKIIVIKNGIVEDNANHNILKNKNEWYRNALSTQS